MTDDLSPEDALAYRFVVEAQKQADARGRDVRVMLAKVIIAVDPEAAARWLDGTGTVCADSRADTDR